MNLVSYFQGVAAELRKVNWPTFPVLIRNFFSVIIGILFATVVVGAFDYVFIKLLGYIIK
jgi:preprotein translocase SecE subunit